MSVPKEMKSVVARRNITYERIQVATEAMVGVIPDEFEVTVKSASPTYGQLTIAIGDDCALILQIRVPDAAHTYYSIKGNFKRPQFVLEKPNPMHWTKNDATSAILVEKGNKIVVKSFVLPAKERKYPYRTYLSKFADVMLKKETRPVPGGNSGFAERNAIRYFSGIQDTSARAIPKSSGKRSRTEFIGGGGGGDDDDDSQYEVLTFSNGITPTEYKVAKTGDSEEEEEEQEE